MHAGETVLRLMKSSGPLADLEEAVLPCCEVCTVIKREGLMDGSRAPSSHDPLAGPSLTAPDGLPLLLGHSLGVGYG